MTISNDQGCTFYPEPSPPYTSFTYKDTSFCAKGVPRPSPARSTIHIYFKILLLNYSLHQADSGGPLICEDLKEKKFAWLGIHVGGANNTRRVQMNVFTSIPFHISWINSFIETTGDRRSMRNEASSPEFHLLSATFLAIITQPYLQ